MPTRWQKDHSILGRIRQSLVRCKRSVGVAAHPILTLTRSTRSTLCDNEGIMIKWTNVKGEAVAEDDTCTAGQEKLYRVMDCHGSLEGAHVSFS